MAIDAYGRPIPDYGYAQDYREQLKRQREAIDYQLSEYDRRYQPQQPIQQAAPTNPLGTPAPIKQIAQPYIVVTSEKEARDYPIVKSFDDEVGKVHFFVMNDESALFAKRINPSSWDLEFEIYDHRRSNDENIDAPSNNDGELLMNIDARLQKIEQFIDGATSMFLGGNALKVPPSDPPKAKPQQKIISAVMDPKKDESGGE